MKVMLIPLAIAAIFFSTGIQIQYNGSGKRTARAVSKRAGKIMAWQGRQNLRQQ
jgi:hypothetical protein